jgi:hypothetical protein
MCGGTGCVLERLSATLVWALYYCNKIYKKLPLVLGLLGYKTNPPPSLISAAEDRVEKCMDGANSLDLSPSDALAPFSAE